MNIAPRALGFIERAPATETSPEDGIDIEKRIICFVASTETSVDSYGSIILQDGLDWETRMAQNPIFVWSHPLVGECETPDHRRALGRVIRWEKKDGKTRIWVRFSDRHEYAREIFGMYVDGDLNACSICLGRPYSEVRRSSPEDEILALPDFARSALLEKRCEFIVARGVVMEVSACLAGSNLETLAERDLLDRRMEARERALCTRAQRMADQLDDRLARIEAAAERLERLAMSPEERALAAFRAEIESKPELKALIN